MPPKRAPHPSIKSHHQELGVVEVSHWNFQKLDTSETVPQKSQKTSLENQELSRVTGKPRKSHEVPQNSSESTPRAPEKTYNSQESRVSLRTIVKTCRRFFIIRVQVTQVSGPQPQSPQLSAREGKSKTRLWRVNESSSRLELQLTSYKLLRGVMGGESWKNEVFLQICSLFVPLTTEFRQNSSSR